MRRRDAEARSFFASQMEKSGLKSEFGSIGVVFVTLIRASQRWRKVTITLDEEIKLMELRDKLNQSEFGSKLSQMTCGQDGGEQTTSKNPRVPKSPEKIFQKK